MAVARSAVSTLSLTLTGDAEAGAAKASYSEDLGGSALSLVNGVLVDQINRWWADDTPRALAAEAEETIDLFDFQGTSITGSYDGEDPLGQPLAISAIAVLMVVLEPAADSGILLVGGSGGADAFSSPFNNDDDAQMALESSTLQPGILLLWNPKGYEVQDVNNHKLKLKASGGPCSYKLYFGMRG